MSPEQTGFVEGKKNRTNSYLAATDRKALIPRSLCCGLLEGF